MAKFVPDAVEELEDALAYAHQAKAQNTRRASKADWNDFAAYLKKRNRSVLPASP